MKANACILALLTLVSVAIAKSMSLLPEQVAAHFGLDGTVNGYQSREFYGDLMVLISFIVPVLLLGLFQAVGAKRREVGPTLISSGRFMAILTSLFLLSLNGLVISANLTSPPRMGAGIWLVVVGYQACVLMLVVNLVLRFRAAKSRNGIVCSSS